MSKELFVFFIMWPVLGQIPYIALLCATEDKLTKTGNFLLALICLGPFGVSIISAAVMCAGVLFGFWTLINQFIPLDKERGEYDDQ